VTSDRLSAFPPGRDWMDMLWTCCAIEARQGRELYEEAMRQPAPPPATPEDVARERCMAAGIALERP
jgi:hypothetical protein